MNWGKVVALTNISLCFVAAFGYALIRDWRKAIYWGLAGMIGLTVTL